MKITSRTISFLHIISNFVCLAWVSVFSKCSGMNLQMHLSKSPVPIAVDKKILGLGVGNYIIIGDSFLDVYVGFLMLAGIDFIASVDAFPQVSVFVGPFF